MRGYWSRGRHTGDDFYQKNHNFSDRFSQVRTGNLFSRFCISKFYMRFGLKNECIAKLILKNLSFFSFPQCIDEETEVQSRVPFKLSD